MVQDLSIVSLKCNLLIPALARCTILSMHIHNILKIKIVLNMFELLMLILVSRGNVDCR